MSRGHDGSLYRSNRLALRRRSRELNAPCAYCGMPIDYDAPPSSPMAFTADHVVPVHAGGSDRMENLVAAHARCNRAKSDRVVQGRLRTKSSATRRWW